MRKTIWGQTIVKNEERFLWFAVSSVIDHLDKILIWDTGSKDKTLEIIKLLDERYPNKIEFKEYGYVDAYEFTKARQEMLDKTKSDWFVIVDGDEVWWRDSIKKVVEVIQKKGDSLDSIVTPHYNIVGDIYHYQEGIGANYKIDNKKGHINIRAVNRKIPGLHFDKPHGQQGLYDENDVLIQNRNGIRIFVDAPYLHFTHLIRSSIKDLDEKVPKREMKFSYEIGRSFPKKLKYPEVFYNDKPNMVPSPWKRMSKKYFLISLLTTPLKKIKRTIIKRQTGY